MPMRPSRFLRFGSVPTSEVAVNVNTQPRSALGTYLAGATLARLADEGVRIAFVLLAVERTGSATFGALLVAALLIPHVVAAPIIGGLADRMRRRSHFQAIVLAVFSLCIALCSALVGYTAEWIIIIIAVVGGCAGPILTGGLTSLVSDIVPESDRERAYGLDNVTYTSAGIGGPSIAGFLGSMLNAGIATLTLAISAGIAALIVLELPIARKIDAAHPPLRFSSVFSLRGISPLWTSRTLRGVTIASTIGTAGTAAVPLAVVLLSEHMYSSSMVGFFLTAFALGGLTGSLLYAHHPFGTSNTDFG